MKNSKLLLLACAIIVILFFSIMLFPWIEIAAAIVSIFFYLLWCLMDTAVDDYMKMINKKYNIFCIIAKFVDKFPQIIKDKKK